MRVEYVVRAAGDGWRVTRGHTTPLDYESFERAVIAAENFARMAVERGESAAVKIITDEVQETRSFEPETLRPLEVSPTATNTRGSDVRHRAVSRRF